MWYSKQIFEDIKAGWSWWCYKIKKARKFRITRAQIGTCFTSYPIKVKCTKLWSLFSPEVGLCHSIYDITSHNKFLRQVSKPIKWHQIPKMVSSINLVHFYVSIYAIIIIINFCLFVLFGTLNFQNTFLSSSFSSFIGHILFKTFTFSLIFHRL